MPIWTIHAGHYLERVAIFAITSGGYTTVGFICLVLLPPVWEAYRSIREARRDGRPWTSVANPKSLLKIIKKPIFLVWAGLTIWAFAEVTYQDHMYFVKANAKIFGDLQNLKNKATPSCAIPQQSGTTGTKEVARRKVHAPFVIENGKIDQSTTVTVNGKQKTTGTDSPIINGNNNGLSNPH